jgi:hypothetical protein
MALLSTTRAQVKPRRRPARTIATYERFELHAFQVVQGWQAVYWDADRHLTADVHALAAVHRVVRNAHTGAVVPQTWRGAPSEDWEVVALSYHPADGWTIVEEVSNFCGLIPPGQTLEAFEACSLCHLHHAAPCRQEGALEGAQPGAGN